MCREFEAGRIDASFVVVGATAPVLDALLGSGLVRPIPLPHVDGLVRTNLFLTATRIPPGFFGMCPDPMPAGEISTLKVRALLLCGSGVSDRLVIAVAQVILDASFQKDAGLAELFHGGKDFARENPDFPIHSGALHAYDPDLRPLLDADFVEATEGMRSFIVSILIAAFLAYRWLRGRRVRGHELREDSGVECFVAMCLALSDKIAGKLLRYRIDRLTAAIARRQP